MLYIDITRLYKSTQVTGQYTGVDRVNLAYIRQFGKDSCAVIRYPKYWLFLPYSLSQAIFDSFFTQKQVKFNQNRWVKRLNKIRYAKPIQLLGKQNYLLHTYHGGLEKPEFLDFMDNYQLKGIYFLHDLIPIEYPEYCRDGEKQKHQIRLNTMSHGKLVICNSQYTLSRWEDYCRINGLNLPKSIFAHLAPDDTWYQPLSTNHAINLPKRPFFLVIGTIEGRKNHLLLLNVWRLLYKQLGETCPLLIIAGKRGWECEQVLDILDRADSLKTVVIERNHVKDDELRQLMATTQALLFPSFVEGFGLPLIEAFYAKVPVIASDITAFRELNTVGIATLISPYDTMTWKETILAFSQLNSPLRQAQQAKLDNLSIEDVSWQAHFGIVNPVVQTILQS